jgi:methyl coenzyme M reductase subunit D
MKGLNVDLVNAVTSVDLVTRALVRGGDTPDLVIFGDDEPVSFSGLLEPKAAISY